MVQDAERKRMRANLMYELRKMMSAGAITPEHSKLLDMWQNADTRDRKSFLDRYIEGGGTFDKFYVTVEESGMKQVGGVAEEEWLCEKELVDNFGEPKAAAWIVSGQLPSRPDRVTKSTAPGMVEYLVPTVCKRVGKMRRKHKVTGSGRWDNTHLTQASVQAGREDGGAPPIEIEGALALVATPFGRAPSIEAERAAPAVPIPSGGAPAVESQLLGPPGSTVDAKRKKFNSVRGTILNTMSDLKASKLEVSNHPLGQAFGAAPGAAIDRIAKHSAAGDRLDNKVWSADTVAVAEKMVEKWNTMTADETYKRTVSAARGMMAGDKKVVVKNEPLQGGSMNLPTEEPPKKRKRIFKKGPTHGSRATATKTK